MQVSLPLFDAPDEDARVRVWTLPSGVRLVQLEDGTYADSAEPEGWLGRPKWRVLASADAEQAGEGS